MMGSSPLPASCGERGVRGWVSSRTAETVRLRTLEPVRPITQAPHPTLYGVLFVKRKNAFSSRRLWCALRLGRFAPCGDADGLVVENDGLSAPPWRRSEARRFPTPRNRGAAMG